MLLFDMISCNVFFVRHHWPRWKRPTVAKHVVFCSINRNHKADLVVYCHFRNLPLYCAPIYSVCTVALWRWLTLRHFSFIMSLTIVVLLVCSYQHHQKSYIPCAFRDWRMRVRFNISLQQRRLRPEISILWWRTSLQRRHRWSKIQQVLYFLPVNVIFISVNERGISAVVPRKGLWNEIMSPSSDLYCVVC